MSNAAANKAILERAYKSWDHSKGKDLEDLIAIFSEDVEFGSLAEGAEPATFTKMAVGKPAMRGYFTELLAQWSMNNYKITDMIAEGDRVAAIGSTSWTCKLTDKTIDTPKVDVWTFRDGKAVKFYEYFDTAGMLKAMTIEKAANIDPAMPKPL
jgi:ketosteroid isomerase-like protein